MLHCPGVSSWLLPHCACSEWQTFSWRGWSTWDLQPGTFSALWGQVTSCWNLSGRRGYIHTELLPRSPAVQECKRHQDLHELEQGFGRGQTPFWGKGHTLHSITSQIQLFQEGKGFLWSLIASSLAGCTVLSASVCFRFGLFWKPCIKVFFICSDVQIVKKNRCCVF